MEPSTVGASLERRVADHRMLIPKMGDPFFAKWSAVDRDEREVQQRESVRMRAGTVGSRRAKDPNLPLLDLSLGDKSPLRPSGKEERPPGSLSLQAREKATGPRPWKRLPGHGPGKGGALPRQIAVDAWRARAPCRGTSSKLRTPQDLFPGKQGCSGVVAGED